MNGSKAGDAKVISRSLSPNGIVELPRSEGQTKSTSESYGFLSAPLTGPVRPLSPDALSILSTDEYDQIHRERQIPRHTRDLTSAKVVSHRGWRLKLTQSWNRNYGLFLMLLAQFFGTCMNVLWV